VFDDDNNPVDVNWDLANDRASRWSLEYAFDLVRQLKETTRQRLRREISRFIENGETVNQLAKRLAPLFGEERARLIAETETTRAFAEGNMEGWKETGVIKMREWRTARDELVCPICGPLSGKVVGMDEEFAPGIMSPPAHPRCRCWIVGKVQRVEIDDGD